MKLNIPVILGTVREGRLSIHSARLVEQKLKEAGHESQVVDFKELPLPFFDNAVMPVEMKGVYPYPNVQAWSKIANEADAFVIVSPEYNHGYPAVLKNALDWLFLEFDHKPVGLVGVSNGAVGGARMIEHLRPILENFNMYALRETVMFPKVQDIFDETGKLIDESFNKKIDVLIKKLTQSAELMKPYPRSKLSA